MINRRVENNEYEMNINSYGFPRSTVLKYISHIHMDDLL